MHARGGSDSICLDSLERAKASATMPSHVWHDFQHPQPRLEAKTHRHTHNAHTRTQPHTQRHTQTQTQTHAHTHTTAPTRVQDEAVPVTKKSKIHKLRDASGSITVGRPPRPHARTQPRPKSNPKPPKPQAKHPPPPKPPEQRPERGSQLATHVERSLPATMRVAPPLRRRPRHQGPAPCEPLGARC
jgi:hypothetical protein